METPNYYCIINYLKNFGGYCAEIYNEDTLIHLTSPLSSFHGAKQKVMKWSEGNGIELFFREAISWN